MGRGGPNGPSSLPRLWHRSSDSNRPCRQLDGWLIGLQIVACGGRVPGLGFRVFDFQVFRGNQACRFAKQIGAQASGGARALRHLVSLAQSVANQLLSQPWATSGVSSCKAAGSGTKIDTKASLFRASLAFLRLCCDCISIHDSADLSSTYESLTAISGDKSESPDSSRLSADFETWRCSAILVWLMSNGSR